jgi:hypothetical protein
VSRNIALGKYKKITSSRGAEEVSYSWYNKLRHMKKIIDQRCDAYFVPDKEVIYAHSGSIRINCWHSMV